MKAINVINNVIMFPFMILMGIFFGIRYIIKETKHFLRDKKLVVITKPVAKMKNSVIALACGLIALTIELSLSLLNYSVHNQPISKDPSVLFLVKRLETLTENSAMLIALCTIIIVAAYMNILKERTKRRNFSEFVSHLRF